MQKNNSSYLKKSCSAFACLFLFSNPAMAGSKKIPPFDSVSVQVQNLSGEELDVALRENFKQLSQLEKNLDEIDLSGRRNGLNESEITQAKISMLGKQRELERKNQALLAKLEQEDSE